MTSQLLKLRVGRELLFRKNLVAEAVAVALITSAFTTWSAVAQENEVTEEPHERITVTATKSEESIQEVALAITAITGDFIEKTRMTDVKDVINFTPSVTGNSTDSFLDTVSIRGIRTDDFGSGGDMSVGVFKNELYQGRAGTAVTSFFDMDRAEVARGPQGFLFGRNAIGGVISNHTRQADTDSNEKVINLEVGEYSRVRVDGAINVPINDNFAIRFAGLYHSEDPYMTNLFPGSPVPDTETRAVRWSINYEDDGLKIFTMIEYEDRKRPGTVYRTIAEGEIYEAFTEIWGEIDVPDDPFTTNSNSVFGFNDNLKQLAIQVKLEKDLGVADLVINAGYTDHDYLYTEDWEGSEFQNGSWKADQTGEYSQIEARLNSNRDAKLSWYAGVSYYTEDLQVDTTSLLNQDMLCQYAGQFYNYYYYYDTASTTACYELSNYLNYALGESYAWEQRRVAEQTFVDAKNSGWAAYLNFNYQITDTLDAEFGIRRTVDEKELMNDIRSDVQLGENFWALYNYGVTTIAPIFGENEWSDNNVRALLRWRPSQGRTFYVSFTEGYKAGGFSTLSVTAPDGGDAFGIFNVSQEDGYGIPSFGPESVDSYEFGYKDTWGKYTDISFTYFMYEYIGLQTVASDPDSGGTIILNLGNVDAHGVEFAMNSQLGEYWDLYLVYSYLSSETTGIQNQCSYGGRGQSIFNSAPDSDACEGSELYWSPEHSGAFVITGSFPIDNGTVYTSLDGWYESERAASFDFLPESLIEDNAIFSATLGYESDEEWWVEAYVENIADEVIYDSAYDGGGFTDVPNLSAFWTPYKPRNFGIRFGYKWD